MATSFSVGTFGWAPGTQAATTTSVGVFGWVLPAFVRANFGPMGGIAQDEDEPEPTPDGEELLMILLALDGLL